MAKIHILITADYELFGNGSGDVLNCMIRPTDLIIKILEKYGAKLTLFAEMIEYWEIKKAIDKGVLDLNSYDPSGEIEKQLKNLISRGHDVQFHMHPQWIGAKFEEGAWKLNYKYWRTPMVPGGLGSEEKTFSLIGLFHKGKRCLERICQPENGNYRCIAFRAGGYCIQPHKLVFKAMEKTGYLADSSVFPGGFEKSEYTYFDFRDVKYYSPYRPDLNDIAKHNPSNAILEIPIYSVRMILPKAILTSITPKANLRPPGCSGKGFDKKIGKRRFLDIYHIKKWDFCTLNTYGMKDILKKALNRNEGKTNILVMTGHPKSFNNISSLDKFLRWTTKIIEKNPDIKYSTFSEAVYDYMENEGEI